MQMVSHKKIIMMKRALLILSVLSMFYTPAHPQGINSAYRDVFLDAEFFLMEEYYIDALTEYMKLYKRGFENNANLNYRIGVCYVNIPGQKPKAIPYLEKATENLTNNYREGSLSETKAPYDVYIYLGNAYRINNQLDKAIAAYEKYKKLGKKSNEDIQTNVKFANQQIQACKNARELQAKPVPVNFINLGSTINNSASNYQPVVSGDETTIAYMNRLAFYDAVYVARKINGEWTDPVNVTPQIQSDGDQFTAAISHDGSILYLTKEDNFDSDIHISEYQEGQWTVSRPLGKNINTKFWESHGSVSKDGQTLYFTSNRKESLGGMDIFYAKKLPNGEWGNPVNMGDVINTPLNESYPVITEDGNTLYFSSQGHYNMGGFDIFYSRRVGDNRWTEPVNIGYPVNTTDDDLFFTPVNNGEYAYMALFREDGLGDEDIYRIEFMEAPPVELAETTTREEKTDVELSDEEKETPIPDEDIIETDTVDQPVKEEQISEDQLPPASPPASRPRISVSSILFNFDSSRLTALAKEKLDKIANAMEASEGLNIELIGHTDAIGPSEYNKQLALRRANAVKSYLIIKGVNEERLKTATSGEDEPIARNTKPDGTDSPEGRKFNRRVDFKILQAGKGILEIKQVEVPAHLKIE